MTGWLLALALARSMDAATSVYALQQPGLKEGVKWMPNSPAGQIAVQAGVATGQLWFLNKLSHKHPKAAKGLALLQVGVSGTVVSMNIRVIRSVR
jgi:uncharacterized protein (DUF2237 family)